MLKSVLKTTIEWIKKFFHEDSLSHEEERGFKEWFSEMLKEDRW